MRLLILLIGAAWLRAPRTDCAAKVRSAGGDTTRNASRATAINSITLAGVAIAKADFCTATPGLEWFSGSIRGVEFAVARVDQRSRQAHLHATTDPVNKSGSLMQYLDEEHALAGVTGGFLKSYYPPLPIGQVVVDGRQLSPLTSKETILNGVVIFDAQTRRVEVRESRVAIPKGAKTSSLQSGPLLVLDGTVRIPAAPVDGGLSPGTPANRAFIAVDATGSVLIGWTGPITFLDLARALADPAGPFRVRQALGLSGGGNAGLAIRLRQAFVQKGDVMTTWHNAIIVR